MQKYLGKIRDIRLGFGGYQDACFGITISFEHKGGIVGDFIGQWQGEAPKKAEWNEQSRLLGHGKMVMDIEKWCKQAGVQNLHQLKNIPVEVTIEDMRLKDWRVLEEVL